MTPRAGGMISPHDGRLTSPPCCPVRHQISRPPCLQHPTPLPSSWIVAPPSRMTSLIVPHQPCPSTLLRLRRRQPSAHAAAIAPPPQATHATSGQEWRPQHHPRPQEPFQPHRHHHRRLPHLPPPPAGSDHAHPRRAALGALPNGSQTLEAGSGSNILLHPQTPCHHWVHHTRPRRTSHGRRQDGPPRAPTPSDRRLGA